MTSNTRTGETAGEATGETAGDAVNTAENGKTFARKRHPKTIGKSAFHSVPRHRAFIPIVTIWGGLFMALITAAAPDFVIARAISLTGVFLPLLAARLILAVAIGLAGALFGFVVASAIARRAKLNNGDGAGDNVCAPQPSDVQLIDPTQDLGSESLDAPIDLPAVVDVELQNEPQNEPSPEPQLGELARRGFAMEAPDDPIELAETAKMTETDTRHKKGAWSFTRNLFKDGPLATGDVAEPEAAPSLPFHDSERDTVSGRKDEPKTEGFAALTADRIARSKGPIGEKPRALGLDEFAALPRRDGVWVEEPSQSGEPDMTALTAVADLSTPQNNRKPASGLEKLRQTPASDLSLVEMVERFAAALHNRQAEERAAIAKGQVTREAALAEALKALSLFTEAGFDQSTSQHPDDSQIHQTEDSLRSALARLQTLRGAA